jgi:hypothetical protein
MSNQHEHECKLLKAGQLSCRMYALLTVPLKWIWARHQMRQVEKLISGSLPLRKTNCRVMEPISHKQQLPVTILATHAGMAVAVARATVYHLTSFLTGILL